MEEGDRMLSELEIKGHLEVTVERGKLVYALWVHRAPHEEFGALEQGSCL